MNLLIRAALLWFCFISLAGPAKEAIGQQLIIRKSYILLESAKNRITYVRTQRTRLGKPEQVDIVNILADSTYFLHSSGEDADSRLNGFYPTDKLLVTLAVLPDEQTGQVTWNLVNIDTLSSRARVPLEAVLRNGVEQLVAYKRQLPVLNMLTRRLDWQPIIKRQGRYYTTPNQVLTEYFLVRRRPVWFPGTADNVTLNCGAQPFAPADFAALQKRLILTFPKLADRPFVAGEIIVRLHLASKAPALYTFWSIPLKVFDGPPAILYFGAVDLKFKPGIGVISGKYPDHFHMSYDNGYNTFFDTVSIEVLTSPK
ncbi:hypothetical protein [Hymenobacter sp. BRD67]|uniref:hypothetical protein n=1 Tax=Hymenobacter sp. BRD67 TaxID=2675877 RepID=UPI0015679906|nr:hypothetical protein [Hymenobacter sp. BRD67]QKG51357.1 hypothetical protein GKZ67_00630 [Hymenobacter sp. BRD67]